MKSIAWLRSIFKKPSGVSNIMSVVLFPVYIKYDLFKEQQVDCLTSILPPTKFLNAMKYIKAPKY